MLLTPLTVENNNFTEFNIKLQVYNYVFYL